MPGPLPNPAARRRNTGSAFTTLPAAGRPGPPPPYPLAEREDVAAQERREDLWDELWALPVAVLWERQRWTLTVARYVEATMAWERDPAGCPISLLAELRQLEQALALSTAALLRARASIAHGDETPAGAGAGATVIYLPTEGA